MEGDLYGRNIVNGGGFPEKKKEKTPKEYRREARDAINFWRYVRDSARDKGIEVKIPKLGEKGKFVIEGDKAMEAYRKVADSAIERLVTHGILVKKGEEYELKPFSDLDGKACIYLCKQAGLMANVEFVSPGEERENAFVMDTSKREGAGYIPKKRIYFVDHHGDNSPAGTSAAEKVFGVLSRAGLIDIDKIPEKTALEKAIQFVTYMDNGEYPGMHNYSNFALSHSTLVGLSRFLPFEMIVAFFADARNLDPLEVMSEEDIRSWGVDDMGKKLIGRSNMKREMIDKSLEKVIELREKGFMLEKEEPEGPNKTEGKKKTKKILVDIGGQISLGRDAAYALGVDVFVQWNPEENGFVIQSRERLGIKLAQGFEVREKMWLKPRNDEKLKVSLEEVLIELMGGEFEAKGELGEYLEKDGWWRLFVENLEERKNVIEVPQKSAEPVEPVEPVEPEVETVIVLEEPIIKEERSEKKNESDEIWEIMEGFRRQLDQVEAEKNEPPKILKKKIGWWGRLGNWFRRLFG